MTVAPLPASSPSARRLAGSALSRRLLFVSLTVLLSIATPFGCDPRQPAPKPLVRRAAFGVLFGGQIQERRELPFELDRAKQTLGFRVEFGEPLASDTDIEWRVDRPARTTRLKANRHPKPPPPEAAPTPLGGKETARAGELRFDRTLGFEPGDPLGLWNVRVVVRGKVVLDRPFEVFDVQEREKSGEVDAGF